MDITQLLPFEILEKIFDFANHNIINIISLNHVNKYLHRNISKYAKNRSLDRVVNCKCVVLANRIEIVQWVQDLAIVYDIESCIIAAILGNLDILKFILNDTKIIDKEIINRAAQCGHLHIVKYILQQYNSTNGKLCSTHIHPSAIKREAVRTILTSCGYDNLVRNEKSLIKYGHFLKDIDHFTIHESTYYSAALGGHIHILKWLLENDSTCEQNILHINSHIYEYAMASGNIELLDWLKNNNCPIDQRNKYVSAIAAKKANIQLLQWANDNGFYWNEFTMAIATSCGNLEIVKWLRSKGCWWNETACALSVIANDLSVLKWLRENNCPWNVTMCIHNAKFCGHSDILKWLLENG